MNVPSLKVDPIIKTHAGIITDSNAINSKVMYSISCLQNAIEYQNANRNANITYLQGIVARFLEVCKQTGDMSDDQITGVLRLLNHLITEESRLTANQDNDLVSIVLKLGRREGYIAEELCHEIISLCGKLKNQGETTKMLLELMTQKMSPEQALRLIDSFRKNELYHSETYQLISLGMHYNNNQEILSRAFQGLHWQIANVLPGKKDSSKEGKEIIDFIKATLSNNVRNIKIVALCALIYRELVDSYKIIERTSVSKNLDYFLRQYGLKGITKPYLIDSDQLISAFSELQTILEAQLDIQSNKSLQYLLYFYSVNEFKWREELLSSVVNGKGAIAKQLLLRATEFYSIDARSTKCINEKDQLIFSNYLPIECLRSLSSIINKLQKQPTPHNALRIIGFYHHLQKNHPQFNDLLLLLLQIYLKNREFASLQQVERIIKDQISGDFVVKKLKEKGTIKNIDSNKESKRYFICIPLVCTRTEAESVSDQLCEIFIHQTVHIALKLYVVDFTIAKMMLQPSKKFIFFFNRYIESNYSSNLLKIVMLCLQPHSTNRNPAVSEWYSKHFGEITQKMINNLFLRLLNPEISETTKLLFLLEKFNAYQEHTTQAFRSILNSLEDINEIYSDHTLDCLEVFQMILEKNAGNVAEWVVSRFQKICLHNWSKFTQEHLYAIERIIAFIDENSQVGIREVKSPPLEVDLDQQVSQKDKKRLITTYVSNITFNLFFNKIDTHTALQALLKLYNQLKANQVLMTDNAAIAVLNLLLFMFEGSEEPVDAKIDEIVILFLGDRLKDSTKVHGKCLEYLSRVPHSINILKLPLNKFTSQGFYNPIWLGDLTELLNIVSESKPKAIGSYKLQENLKSMFVYLIASENKELIDAHMDFLQATCFIEGDYQQVLDQALPAFENILKAERCGVDYRKSLVQFTLGGLLDYEYKLSQELLWFLLSKYASDAEIISLILEYFEKFPIQNSVIHQKLLMRVVMIHTQDQKIQQKCKELFKLHAPKSSKQQQLIENFGNSNYVCCEELISEVSNPYALTFSLADIRSLLQWKNTADSCKKLLRFLHNHPQNQNKFYQCEAFILNSQYISYLTEVIDRIQAEMLVQRFHFNGKKAQLIMKKNQSLEILEKTMVDILKNKQSILKLKGLYMDTFKNRQDDFSTLIKLPILIFTRQKKEKRTNEELRQYAKFWNEINGDLELKDKEKANRFLTKNLLYIFPIFLGNSEIISPYTHFNSLLAHYRSLLLSYSVIQKEIGSNRYFVLLARTILQQSKNTENKGSFVEEYIKAHLLIEGNEEIVLKEDDKDKYKQILVELLLLVNKVTQGKSRDSNSKMDSQFIFAYISHILFLINQAVTLDVATLEIVKSINSGIDALTCVDNQKEIMKEALQWIIKHIEKNLPTKVEPKVQAKAIEENNYVSKKNVSEKSATYTQLFQPQEAKTQSKQYESIKREPAKSEPIKNAKNQQDNSQPYQSRIRYKETQQKVTILQTITTNKTTIVIVNSDPSKTELFTEQVEKPREESFNEDKFYKSPTAEKLQEGPSQSERKANLEKVQKLATGDISIQSLKDHCKFISSLSILPMISPSEFSQLRTSIESLTETVSSHSFYVRKVCELEISIKLVRIYKTLWRSGQKKLCENLVLEILKLFLGMSRMKQRKLALFGEQEVIQFFKMVVKRRLNGQGQEKEIEYLVEILYNCRNNNEINFALGLISMLIEVINREKDASVVVILEYFIKLELTPEIINEIYQRGSFNKLVQTFSLPLDTDHSRRILSLWIKLAGKVCINQSIQQKFRSKELHLLVWNKTNILKSQSQRKDITYFFAYLCLKNQAITEWMIQTKVPEEILASLGDCADNEELYLLFYHFCFGNTINRDYCFRIKYQVHLLSRLLQRWNETQQNLENIQLNKYFFKSLGQLMTSRLLVSTFFKEEAVRKLIDIYNVKCEPSIFQCLLDFISALETEAQFDELKRQNFWDALKIFEFKISSEATYSYLLQIFLIMIKKGRTKQFAQTELRNKVCLKAEFSINMEGKELALRFLLALSIKDKENYLTERSVGLLASILGFKVSKNELQLACDMLKVQGATKNEQFLRFFLISNVHGLIAEGLQKLNEDQTRLALQVLLIFSNHASNRSHIAEVCIPVMKRLFEKDNNGQNFNSLIQLLAQLSESSESRELFEFSEIQRLVKGENVAARVKEKNCANEYAQLTKNLDKMKGIAVAQINNQQMLRKAVENLRQGKKVKMYKTDGSISQLLIFISSDCLELNCGLALSEVVKQKWRLPINEITKVIDYPQAQSSLYQNSYFQKNSGFFNKPPPSENCLSLIGKSNEFHICFAPGQKQHWKANFEQARVYACNLLSKFGK